MTNFEAVQQLAGRARRASRVAWGLGALAILLGCAVALLGQWVFLRHIGGPVSVALCVPVVAGLASLTRKLTRRAIELRRRTWIDELARTEGLNADVLAESFTLDSW